MIVLLTIVHVSICFFLVIVVLLQSGKAADLAGAFGGMGSQTAFGPRGSETILAKATRIAAAVFMVTSLTLAIFSSRNAGSSVGATVLEKHPVRATQSAPLPAGAPPGQAPIRVNPGAGGQPQTIPIQIPIKPGVPAPKK
jgi:preprotein translocase subunit SecG